MKIVSPRDGETEEHISFVGRIILVIVGLCISSPIIFGGALFTAFAGTVHGAPDWYLIYLGITQVIPILVATVSWVAILFTISSDKFKRIWAIALLSSFLVYGASFLALFSGFILPK